MFAVTPSVQSPAARERAQIGNAPVGPQSATYLKTLSDIVNGERINLLRCVPKGQWAGIRAYTSTYDVLSDVSSVMSDMNTAKRGDLYVPDGLFYFSAPLTGMPLKFKLHGATRRGFGSAAANYRGSILFFANANNHGIDITQGSQTPVDIIIERLSILNAGGGAGAFNGINMVKVAGVDLQYLVVANFAAHGVYASGGYSLEAFKVYAAQNGNSNFYLDQEFGSLKSCRTDGGLFGIKTTSLGFGTAVEDSHFEGATTRGAQIDGDRNRIVNTYIVQNDTTSDGLSANGTNLTMTAVEVLGQPASTKIGVQVGSAAYGYSFSSVKCRSFDKAMELNAGAGVVTGCVLKGLTTGVDLIDGGDGYVTDINGNYISGGTHSIKHTSGTRKWKTRNNTLRNGTDSADLPMTRTAGVPLIEGHTPAPRVSCSKSATQSLTTATYTALSFDTEAFDTDTLHDNATNNTRLTARIGGKYRITYSIQYAAAAAGTLRSGRLRKNGATLIWNINGTNSIGGGNDDILQGAFTVQLDATEYVELEGYQASGGNLNVQNGVGTQFQMEFVGDG